jgi:hypothetical protein
MSILRIVDPHTYAAHVLTASLLLLLLCSSSSSSHTIRVVEALPGVRVR